MQEAAEQFAIRVHELVVGFRRHVVIDHLDLDVRRGEILGLVGASGGGKMRMKEFLRALKPRVTNNENNNHKKHNGHIHKRIPTPKHNYNINQNRK